MKARFVGALLALALDALLEAFAFGAVEELGGRAGGAAWDWLKKKAAKRRPKRKPRRKTSERRAAGGRS